MIRTELGGDGVLVAVIDMPGRTMNVFSPELIDALEALLLRVESDGGVQSVVLTSGKPGFLAGADLSMVRGFTQAARHSTREQMFELCGRLGRQFLRIEQSAKPWVAAVNGIALGGGLELALACRTRIVADDPRIQLGVPEVRLGLLPGAGGTQRLPRLAGFDAAMDLLLTGRSIPPADAVRLGVFIRAVPAARLLNEATEAARALHDRPYDAHAKYAQLSQSDVPAWSAAAARALAARQGVDDEMYRRYPAHEAIVTSVMKGARLPLADACDVEMHQFLRLVFDPVAGRLVRTLFLERLRAERELAAPPGAGIERVSIGALDQGRAAWGDALAKAKVPQNIDAALPADTLEVMDLQGERHRALLRTLDDAPVETALPQLVLAPASPYGRVIEIAGARDADAAVLAALAARLRALPWRTPGPASVLQRLRGRELRAQAEVVRQAAALPGAGDPAFFDVAACLSGVSPAWSGGPLCWLAEQAST